MWLCFQEEILIEAKMVTLAADPQTKRLQCLLRHIEDVREDCELLGTRLIERGEFEFGKTLIQHGMVHDNSKFEGIEWEELNGYHDHLLKQAINIHVKKNPHHPEYWQGGIHEMPRIYIAEMVCDWSARSSEFGTSFWEWVQKPAMTKFQFNNTDRVYQDIIDFASLLHEKSF